MLADEVRSRKVVAHEAFHLWLGIKLREPQAESWLWFKEGFTEYLAL